ncbi:MAG: anthranilate synthase component I [Candidatus Nitrosopolaris wilkensis]|nr:MAG: anthranilate synthase component I [Candidatus Nitrosopolaris wilkensis]
MPKAGNLVRFLNNKLHIEKIQSFDDQFGIFKRLYHQYDKVFIFESLVGPKELSEFSLIGFDPELKITCDTNKFSISDRSGVTKVTKVVDPLVQLREVVPKVSDNRFRYLGGAVGYVSYDAVRFWDRLPLQNTRKHHFPLLEFGIFTDGILYNHIEKQAYYFSIGPNSRIKEVKDLISESRALHEESTFSYSTPERNVTRKQFIEKVNKSKKYIYDGDVFQVVLSKRMTFKISGDLLTVYEKLRDINPSPYMYFFRMGGKHIIGSSPEMLLRVTGDRLETFPIAGTRPVADDDKRNQQLSRDLLNDEKEVAEHTMLVDLARNDIGKVSKYGTVQVKELMKVKRFSHVQHMISHVTGILQSGFDSYDAFRAVFPAGTVSGAPKLRAMEIIDELEPNFRGPYAGALGYFSANGSCDFAITIRSIFANKSDAFIQSGAGIVMDSIPQMEWAETEQKADALLSALEKSKATSKS